MSESVAPRASVIVRCFDEVDHIGRLMTGIFHQTVKDVEVIVVDSGSTDGTLDVVRSFPVQVIGIDAAEFSFGRSLNRGCEVARGEILIIISAHCYPTYDDWLARMLEPFSDPKVSVVYGKQRGGDGTKFSEHRIFEQWFSDDSDSCQDHPFSNNANCAVRRDHWLDRRYDEDLTGLEDLAWSKQALAQGYSIAYSADAEIVHLHDESPRRIYNRYRREAIAFKEIMGSGAFGIRGLLKLTVASIWADMSAARKDHVLLKNLSWIWMFRTMQYWGAFRGFRFDGPLEDKLRRKLYYPHRPGRSAGPARRADAREIPYPELEKNES